MNNIAKSKQYYALSLILNVLRKRAFRGRARIIRALASCLTELQAFPVMLSPITSINVDLRDDSAIIIFLDGGLKHEQGFLKLLTMFLKPGDVFWDIGANHGYYSLLLSEPSYQLSKVIAFEPNPVLAEEIEKNAVNRSNVVVMAAGLSSENGSGVLSIRKHSTAISTFRRPNFAAEAIEVPVFTLDGLITAGDIPPANVIKLDVEGFEYKVLLGYSLRDAHRPAIFMEWIEEFFSEIDVTFRDLQTFLGDSWIIYRIENDGTLRDKFIEKPGTTNDLLLVQRDTTYHELARSLVQQ